MFKYLASNYHFISAAQSLSSLKAQNTRTMDSLLMTVAMSLIQTVFLTIVDLRPASRSQPRQDGYCVSPAVVDKGQPLSRLGVACVPPPPAVSMQGHVNPLSVPRGFIWPAAPSTPRGGFLDGFLSEC